MRDERGEQGPASGNMDEAAERLAEQLESGIAFNRKYFSVWERHGFHITPAHFYQPVPTVSQLKDDLWECASDLPGINLNEAGQIVFLNEVCPRYRSEYERFPYDATKTPHEYYFNQLMFRTVDAEVLHCMIRQFRPERVLEVGSGFSSLVSAHACDLNTREGRPAELICIEPCPSNLLQEGFPGLGRLIPSKLEDVDRAVFADLRENDILFIDSSHVLRIGNDVYYEYLQILPTIAPGVLVHIHDIFFPLEYPKTWIKDEYRFWTEQYLLQAFLMFNGAFEVLWAGCYMHCRHSEKLRRAFPAYEPETTLPGSFWMRRRTG